MSVIRQRKSGTQTTTLTPRTGYTTREVVAALNDGRAVMFCVGRTTGYVALEETGQTIAEWEDTLWKATYDKFTIAPDPEQ